MYPVFESIAVLDGVYQNLAFHQKRMQYTANRLWQHAFTEDYLAECLPPFTEKGRYKCRFLYNEHNYSVSFESYTPRIIRKLILVEAPALDYGLKYVNREGIEHYTKQLPAESDALFTRNGFLSDTSYANIALKSGDTWFTPEQPLLPGTRRAAYLVQGLLIPKAIHRDALHEYEMISWFNALLPLGEVGLPVTAIV